MLWVRFGAKPQLTPARLNTLPYQHSLDNNPVVNVTCNMESGIYDSQGEQQSDFAFLSFRSLETKRTMLDHFKNPPNKYRYAIESYDLSLSPCEIKRNFDRIATRDLIPRREHTVTEEDAARHFPHVKLLLDYATRVNYALSQGAPKPQVALLEPDAGHITELALYYIELYRMHLPEEHIEFAVLDEESVRRATAVDQSLIVGSNHYELLMLPPLISISYAAAIKIQEFVEDGGQLIATLCTPTQDSQGNRHEEIQSIFEEIFCEGSNAILLKYEQPSELVSALRESICTAIKPYVSIRLAGKQCRDIAYAHRVCEDGEIFFFANGSYEPREIQMSIRCDRAPHILDPESGERIALVDCTQRGSRTILLHRFEPCSSLLLCFTDEPSLIVPAPKCEACIEIRIPPDKWTLDVDSDERNTLCYSQVVGIPEFLRCQRVLVRLGDPNEAVEFVVNGASAGIRAWPPYEMDITALVKPGPNEIILRLTNHLLENPPSRPSESVTIVIY